MAVVDQAYFHCNQCKEFKSDIRSVRVEKQTVDLTPSWSTAIEICLRVLQDGTPAGKAMARHELMTIAEHLDAALPGNAPAVGGLK